MYSGYFRPCSCCHLHEPVFLLLFLLTFYISATTRRIFMFVMASPVPTNRRSSVLGTDTQPCLFPALSSCFEPAHTGAKDAEAKYGEANRARHTSIYFPPVRRFEDCIQTIHPEHSPVESTCSAYSFFPQSTRHSSI